MIDDLRHLKPTGDDAFQVMSKEFAGWLLIVALILTAIMEGRAVASSTTVYLDPSHNAATLDECQRAAPDLGRPSWTVSQRKFSNRPWTKRVCGW